MLPIRGTTRCLVTTRRRDRAAAHRQSMTKDSRSPSTVWRIKTSHPGAGTTPKFHCSVPGNTDEDGNLIRYKIKPHFKGQSPDKRNGEIYGEFLSSRFSKALGFFADDEWVADVNCPDCEKSLKKSFQGASFSPFQPAAGIELPLGARY